MTNPSIGTTHTIKVAPGTTPQQTQAIFNALQQQQQMQRQNSNQNLRLQAGGSLVAVTVQPQQQQQQQAQQQSQAQQLQTAQGTNIILSQQNTSIDSNVAGSTQQSQTQQQQQQVRNIVKKRLQSYRVTKQNP